MQTQPMVCFVCLHHVASTCQGNKIPLRFEFGDTVVPTVWEFTAVGYRRHNIMYYSEYSIETDIHHDVKLCLAIGLIFRSSGNVI
jgi:hypothetical protein